MINLNLLRVALDNLEKQGLDAFRHIDAVEGLKTKFHHSIKEIESRIWLPSFTCLVYVMGFAGNATYSAVIKKASPKEPFAGKDFFNWLVINKHLIQIMDRSESVGDFIVYFNSYDEFRHIGILSDKRRVKSKWGQLGLYEHEVFEVPASYGDDIKYFESIKYDVAINIFKHFAAEVV